LWVGLHAFVGLRRQPVPDTRGALE
jgi:hypothetical protein